MHTQYQIRHTLSTGMHFKLRMTRMTRIYTDCETNPAGYKLCSPYTCVTMNTPCRKLFWLFYFIIKNSMKEKL
jgi:hypothetical protein